MEPSILKTIQDELETLNRRHRLLKDHVQAGSELEQDLNAWLNLFADELKGANQWGNLLTDELFRSVVLGEPVREPKPKTASKKS